MKVVGLVKVRQLIKVIDALNLDANPRASKVGPVTHAIQDSLSKTPDLFPFKTKGILLGASKYEALERERWSVTFVDPTMEGILDGGHNMLAIGLSVLEEALASAGEPPLKRVKTWDDFKAKWLECHDHIDDLLDTTRNPDIQPVHSVLDVLVPVELVIPADQNPLTVTDFKSSLFEICEARNNNVQLSKATKANKQGYFDPLKRILAKKNPGLASRIVWKTNDGGNIRAENLIALTWIPLALLDGLTDGHGKPVKTPAPTTLYSGKEGALDKFEAVMDSDAVTAKDDNGGCMELKSVSVLSAFEIAADLPTLYDYIYANFPNLYNKVGGRYGGIKSVKALNKKEGQKPTPFGTRTCETASPEGFITPYVYGLQALMAVSPDDEGHMRVHWDVSSSGPNIDDVIDWLDDNLEKVVDRCWQDISPWNYNPQSYGKARQSYDHVLDSYKMVKAGL